MTFTATGEPSNLPPRVHLQLDTDVSGATFHELTIYRDGSPIRLQPPTGTEETETYDYEMPFGQAVDYVAAGSYLPFVAPDFTENWANLASWTGSGWSLGAGDTITSTTFAATILRTASATIQRVSVTDPQNVVLLLSSTDEAHTVVVGTTQDGFSSLGTDTESFETAGSGSYTVTLIDGVATVTGADGWTMSANYLGDMKNVRFLSGGGQFGETSSFAATHNPDLVAASTSGTIFTLDQTAKTVRKFTSAGVFQAQWSVTGTITGFDADSADNTYVTDSAADLVRKYNSSGTAGTTWSTTGNAQGIAVDGADAVYVIDSTNDLVRKYTSTGTAGITWASADPFRIASNKSTNHIAVTDGNSSDVTGEVFTSAGALVDGFTITSPDGDDVNSLALDAADNLYLNARAFTAAGGVEVTGISIAPHVQGGIAFTSSGGAVVGDETDDTVRAFTTSTASVGTVTVTPAVAEVAFFETETATLNISEAWLIHPAQPTLSVSIDSGTWRPGGLNVDLASSQQHNARATTTLHYPVGRSRPVAVVHGNRLEDEWQLVLIAPELEHRDAVKDIVNDQTPLLLRSPTAFGWDLPDGFYSVQDVVYDRPFAPLGYEDRTITLPLIPTDPPVIRVAVDRTYADVLAQNDTYADIPLVYDTYADLLLGTS